MERTEREELFSYISDAHKDARGYRPRDWQWAEWTPLSTEELKKVAEDLSAEVHAEIEHERAVQKLAAERFEAHITNIISTGAKDRETAIRWDIQGLGLENDVKWYGMDAYCFHYNLPYSYFKEA
jgi:urocanate hydratase